MSLVAFATAGQILNDAAAELGLIAADMADPFTSAATDPNIYRLVKYFKSGGRDIVREKNWTQNQQQFVFQTVAGQEAYSLPSDFLLMIPQTFWNRSNRLPVGGALSPQLWQYLSARKAGVVFTVLFRPLQQQIHLYPGGGATPGSYQLAFEYISSYWVQPSSVHATSGMWQPATTYALNTYISYGGNIYTATVGGTSGTGGPTGTGAGITDGTVTWNYVSAAGADAPTASTDLVMFDYQLMLKMLKFLYRRGNGFDYSAEQAEYQKALEGAINTDTAAPTLKLGSSGWNDPLIGDRNVPLTGFGS